MKFANGTLEIAGVRYKPEPASSEMKSAWMKLLANETVQYHGKRHYRNPEATACPLPPEFANP